MSLHTWHVITVPVRQVWQLFIMEPQAIQESVWGSKKLNPVQPQDCVNAIGIKAKLFMQPLQYVALVHDKHKEGHI